MSKKAKKHRKRRSRGSSADRQLGGAAAGATIGGLAGGPAGAFIGGVLGAIFFGDSGTQSREGADMKKFVARSKRYKASKAGKATKTVSK